MRSSIWLAAALVLAPFPAHALLNASSLKLTVYKFAVSTSADCSSPATVFTSVAGVEVDMVAGGTFGAGSLDAGTYPCVMIETSKIVKITPTGGATCVAAFNDVICNDSGQTSKLLDGTTTTCSGGISNNQHVVMYLNTLRTAANCGNNCFLPPTSATDTTGGIKLTNPFVVTTDAAGTLTITKGFITDGTPCSTTAPTFAFQ